MPISGKMYYWGEKARNVPEEPGVYALYDVDEKLIYIGKAGNLRAEFSNYLAHNFSNDNCKRETKYYKRELTSEKDGRFKNLVEEYKKEHGAVPKCNIFTEETREMTAHAFHFYEKLGKPLSDKALNLQDFQEKVGRVSIASLEFHQKRGDFAKWIQGVINDVKLVEDLQKISTTGENLRKDLLNLLNHANQATCPNCGNKTTPTKTWKMAGRPSKAGERLQLTIGYFKCTECNQGFRRVLAKERIKAS